MVDGDDSAYTRILGSMAEKRTENSSARPLGSATGAPSPSGVGTDASLPSGMNPRTAAAAAVQSLKTLKPFFPGMADAIDGWIAQVVAQARPGASSSPPMGGPMPSMPAPPVALGGPAGGTPPPPGAPIAPPPVP